MASLSVLVLDHAAIERLFLPGQMVDRWWQPILDEIEVVAVKNIVENDRGWQTGELAGSIRRSVTPAGRQRLVSHIRAEAPHALRYHDGNGPGPIFANKSFMVFPGRFGAGKWRARSVRAFDGNPFLTDAMTEVLRFNGILGG